MDTLEKKVKDFKKKIKELQKDIKKLYKDMRKNPKLFIINLINGIIEAIKNNMIFFIFVITLLFNTIILRYFTIHTTENLLLLKPVLADLAIILAVGGLGYFVKEKNRFTYFLVASIIMSAICIINSIYYTFYTSYVSVSLLSTSKYLGAVGDAVFENVLKLRDFIYVISPLCLIVTYFFIKRKAKKLGVKKDKNNRSKSKAMSIITVAAISAFCVLTALTPTEISRFAKQWNREYLVMRFGIFTYQINDVIQSVQPQLTTLFGYDKAMKTFKEYYSEVPETQEYKNKYTNKFKGKNIIAIHAESMQSFVIGLEFNGEEVTPNLNKLTKKSLYFSNFYSQVSVGTSSDSEFTLNTSLMPTSTGTAFVSYYDREYVSIPKLLKEQGYYAFSMHGNNGSYWNRDIMHKSLGYDKFYSKSSYDIDEVIGLGLSDKSFFKQSVEKIKEINEDGKPFYGTVIMLTNHTPFSDTDKYGEFDVDIKEEITNEAGEKEIISHPYMEGTKLGNYLKSVHYADEALGEFLANLEEAGIMENTVIVLYGDHDARLPKTDFRKLYNYDKDTEELLPKDDPNYKEIDNYQTELLRKVPFLIYSKETEKSLHKEITTVMGMYDVMPTLGNMFGFYNKYQLGKDIFQTKDDNIVVFPSGNFVTNKIYYNSQKNAYLSLKETEITEEYIKECNAYADRLLKVSNSLIVFDLIKKDQELLDSNEDYIDERNIEQ